VEVLKRFMAESRKLRSYESAGLALLSLLIAACAAMPTARADASYSEDAVKAAYLYRFAGYVEWPDANSPFVIAVLGAPEVANELQRLLPEHPIKSGIARVHEISRLRDLGAAQILYVGAGHADALRAAASQLAQQSVLLVTDETSGLDFGSVVNFLTVDHHVRFEVSLTAADRQRLKVSSQLLSVAIRVQGGHRQSNESAPPRAPWDGFEAAKILAASGRRPPPALDSRRR
jgi:hypothetical protein